MEPSFRSRAGVARPGSLRWRSKMLLAGSAAFILAAATPASAIVINDALDPLRTVIHQIFSSKPKREVWSSHYRIKVR